MSQLARTNESHAPEYRVEYREIIKEYRDLITKKKKEYIKNKLMESENDTQKILENLKKFISIDGAEDKYGYGMLFFGKTPCREVAERKKFNECVEKREKNKNKIEKQSHDDIATTFKFQFVRLLNQFFTQVI